MWQKIAIIIIFLEIFGGGYYVWTKKYNQQRTTPATLEQITVQLKFFHQAQFAGIYTADQEGFYKEQGIQATIMPFSGSIEPIEALKNGQAQFAVLGASEVIKARSQNIPIKAIAVIYKINPVVAYTFKSSGITKPQQFIGKKIGIENTEDIQMIYGIAMDKINMNRNNIKEISIGFEGKELIDGTVDVATGYSMNEPYQAMKTGKDVQIFLMADYGAKLYADVIVTTDTLIQKNPTLVKRFITATIKGWEFAIENPEKAVEEILLYATNRDKESQQFMLEKSIPFIRTGDISIGIMTEEEWQKLIEAMHSTVSPSAVYTNDFISSIHE